MNLKSLNYIIIILIGISMSSCQSYVMYRFNYLNPGRKALPDHVQSFTLLNRAKNNEFKQYSDSLLFKELKLTKEINVLTVLDSLAADTALHAAAIILNEEADMETVLPYQKDIPKETSSTKLSPVFPPAYVLQVCERLETDALITLDHLSVGMKTQLDTVLSTEETHWAYARILPMSYWRIYDGYDGKLIDEVFLKDSVDVRAINKTVKGLKKDLSNYKDLVISYALQNADAFTSMIMPYPVRQQRRLYINGNSELKKAGQLALNDEWDKAAEIWEGLTTHGSRKIRSMAEANMGLAAEMAGNLNEAIEWLNRSNKTQYRSTTHYHASKISKRIKLINKWARQQSKKKQ
ncbi:hypothetical protein EYV94_18550 [Puteibacter caeruleilacunae]|nr:hypothetical protein EYV94_18550 [Puteibacter caeruleilacunae]